MSGVTSNGETLYAAVASINEDDYYAHTEEVQLYIAAAAFGIAAYTTNFIILFGSCMFSVQYQDGNIQSLDWTGS